MSLSVDKATYRRYYLQKCLRQDGIDYSSSERSIHIPITSIPELSQKLINSIVELMDVFGYTCFATVNNSQS